MNVSALEPTDSRAASVTRRVEACFRKKPLGTRKFEIESELEIRVYVTFPIEADYHKDLREFVALQCLSDMRSDSRWHTSPVVMPQPEAALG